MSSRDEWKMPKLRKASSISPINTFISIESLLRLLKKKFYVNRTLPAGALSLIDLVLVSCCPEAFVSILLCETLLDDEIVILRGCKRFVDYTGYAETFRYQGAHQQADDAPIQDILVFDACFCDQFSSRNLHRDLGKALAGFEQSRNERIVTGHWGCGAFGGDFTLKFLQQICAAMVLNEQIKRLDYSVYGDEPLATYFTDLLKRLQEKRKSVADVYQLMLNYQQGDEIPVRRTPFRDHVDRWLNDA